MAAVFLEIQQVVQNISGGRSESKREKRQCRGASHGSIKDCVRRDCRGKDQEIFYPLMKAHGAKSVPEAGAGRWKHSYDISGAPSRTFHSRRGVHENGMAA